MRYAHMLSLCFCLTVLLKVRTKMSKQEMDSALDYLSSEGHIYSTIDEDHFKTTDE